MPGRGFATLSSSVLIGFKFLAAAAFIFVMMEQIHWYLHWARSGY